MPSRPLLDAWKAAAKAKRERLQRLLSATLPPGQSYRRSVLVNQVMNSVNQKKDWVTAFDDHLEHVREVLEGAGSTGASATKMKSGSLGD